MRAANLLFIALVVSCNGISTEEEAELLSDYDGPIPISDEFLDATGAAPAPAPALAPVPPAPPKSKPGPHADLAAKLKARRKKRLTLEAHKMKEKYKEAQVEKKRSDRHLSKEMAKLAKVQTKIAEGKSARDAAKKQTELGESKIIKAHLDENMAKEEYKKVGRKYQFAKSMLRGAEVDVAVAAAAKNTGGGSSNLKKSAARREEADQAKKDADASVVVKKLAKEKMKAALEAAKKGYEEKREALKAVQGGIRKADKNFASAVYDIKQETNNEEPLLEENAQAKAEDKFAAKAERKAHELATAAVLKASGDKKADEAEMNAMLGNPKEQRKLIREKVKDQDGISNQGKNLVASKKTLENDFINKFDKLPFPDNSNAILNARVAANLIYDTKDAQNLASSQGPATATMGATIAAAESP